MPRKPAMLKKAALTFAAVIALAGSACAGDRNAVPPPAPGAASYYYGPVNTYYGPVTINAAQGSAAYPATAYPAQGSSQSSSYYGAGYATYGAGYATAPGWDANSYGVGYDWSHGYGYGYGAGGGYAYPGYGYGTYGYPSAQRLDPWAGYNGGWGNGYW